jgi:hypothetical protein
VGTASALGARCRVVVGGAVSDLGQNSEINTPNKTRTTPPAKSGTTKTSTSPAVTAKTHICIPGQGA